MAKPISQQIEGARESIRANRQAAEAIRQEAKTEGGWPTGAGNPQTTTQTQKMDMQFKRKEERVTAPATAQKLSRAKQLYDQYLNTEEYKQGRVAALKAQTDEWMQATLAGSEAYTPSDHRDRKELELKALVDHYTEQLRREEEHAITEADLQELEGWDEADRGALERYIINRNTDFANRMNPLADAGFVPQTADRDAAALMEKYGRDKVNQLAESLERSRSEETTAAVEAAAREGVNKGTMSAVGHNLGSMAASGVGGLQGLFGYLQELGKRTGRYETLDANNLGNLGNVYANAVRSQTAENISGDMYDEEGNQIADGGKLRQFAAYAYQGGMSAADSLARLGMGGGAAGAAGLAAAGSFSQALSEASARGATPGEAAAIAGATAGIEYLSEKIPLEELADAAKAGGHGLKEILKNALLQGGVEASTEELSLMGTTLTEAVILREKAGYQQRVNELIASGMDPEAAEQRAFGEAVEEAKDTAIVSFLSGGMSEAGASIAGNLTHRGSGQGRNSAQVQQAPESAANTQQEDAQQPAMTPEAAAEQLGRESSTAEPMRKTEREMTLDQAIRETFGQEGNDFGSRGETLERLRAQEESLRGAAEAYAGAGDSRTAAEVEAQRQEYGDRARAAQGDEETRIGSLTDRDAPAEPEVRYPGESSSQDPIRERNWEGVGSRKVKAYMAENPEVKPFIQQEAQAMAEELGNTTKGERWYNEEIHYESGGEKGWGGTKRHTSEDIAELRDSGMSYEQIGKGLNDIIEDHGKENSAAAKRVEMQLNDRLRSGHKDFMTGKWVSPNQAYIQAVNEAEANRAAEGSFDALMEDADTYAPSGQDAERGTQRTDTGRVSSQGEQPGIKGAGAAERGFTAKQAMINEYGNIPEGENPVRPDQLPASTDGTDRVSYTARTALEARVTPEEFVPLIENETVRGGFSFIPIHNDDTVRAATAAISREGWQTSRANWTANVRSGVTSPEITATGALLYNHAVNAGDHQEAMDILMDYQMAVRNTARSLQAARILKTLTPADRLYMIRRSVQAMVDDMGLDHPVEIDTVLARQYQNAGTQEEADGILDQIAADVARQIPATGMEAFTALRYLNMLGNFRTQIRNVAGNAGSKLVYGLKDKIGASIEAIASAATGGRVERTKAFRTDAATRQAAAQDYDNVRRWLLGGGRYNDNQTESEDFARRVQDRRQLLPRGLEQYRRVTQWAMEAGDELFTRSAYTRALAGYLNARGIRTDNLETVNPDILDRAREYAVRQAQEQTFRDNNQISDFVGGILRGRNTPPWARVIGEGIMPFRKTPANVLVRAEEFSPLGIINSAVNTVRAARGEITGAELIDSWSKSLTGTALFALGMALTDFGVLSGGPDEGEEKAEFDRLNGLQDYAVTLTVDGQTYTYTIDWATPAAMPLFMGAELQKLLGQKEELQWADLEKVLTSVGDPLIQMSMLQGVSDTLDSVKYADNNLGQFLINAAMSYLTQGLTNTLLGQMERSTEGTRQTTYVDPDSGVPKWLQRQLGKASQKIPGWDYQQTDYIDARGQAEQQPTGALGWLYNLASPGYVDRAEVDALSKELYRLNEAGVEGNVFPQIPETTVTYTDREGNTHKDEHLTAQQAEILKRETGQRAARIANDLIRSEEYAAMSDAQKAKAIQEIYRYAKEAGEIAAVGDSHEGFSSAWMEELEEGKEAAYIARKVTGGDINEAMSALFTAWNKDYDDSSRRDDLEWAYETFRAMDKEAKAEVKDWATGTAADYIEAREGGVSHDSFLDVAKLLEGITPEGEHKNPRDIQKAEAISRRAGLTDKQKELLIRQQVSDSQGENIDQVKALGYDVDMYVKLYRDHEDYTSGTGKKKRTMQHWMEKYGIDAQTAKALYEVFS